MKIINSLTKLTKEQKEMMPIWAQKWIDIGLRTGETDWDTFDKYIRVCYEKAKIPFPNKIIRVESPIVGAFASSIADRIINTKKVRDAVGDAVGGAVEVAVGVAVKDAVRGAVGVAVRSAVGDAVAGAVEGAVGDAVEGAVGDAVEGAVGDAVEGAVRDAVGDAVGDAVEGAVRDAVERKNAWHYWLGGQMWVGYWYSSPSVTSYFFEVCGLKLEKDIMERAEAYRKICESVNYIWLNRDFVMVCARPKQINRNILGQLHSVSTKSIEYPDGWGLYHLNGVKFPESLWKEVVSGKMPFEKIMAIVDIDQRTQAMRFGDVRKFLEHSKAEKLDSYQKSTINGETINYELFKIGKGVIFREDAYYMIYDCPSTKKIYMSGVEPFTKVEDAMSWKQQITPAMWKLQVPLQHES